MFEPAVLAQRLERLEHRLTTLDHKLDSIMATAQNVLDAAQNTASAVQNLVPAVQALSDRIAHQPQGLLTPEQGDQILSDFTGIATAVQSAVDALNSILPQS